ncbi:MAG: HAD-IC family P-type ATPase [Leptospirillia bacterium]
MNGSEETFSGLTTEVASERLRSVGPNAVSLSEPSRIQLFFLKLWGPIPWMLETAFLLEFYLGKKLEAGIIIVLLFLNALLAFLKEQKGQKALALLKSRLEIRARVRRDGVWQEINAEELVPGDLVHIRTGDFVPADMDLLSGYLLVDQSSLTGESLPAEKNPKDNLWSGSLVRRGEGTGLVTRTGPRCAFGKTAKLVHDASTLSHFEEVVLQIVRALLIFDLVLAILLFPMALHAGSSPASLIPFVLILLVSAIPVALPPTFTLANSLSAERLSRKGVLVTRLSAISDAAVMEELLCDKTGTLTENRLSVQELRPVSGVSEKDLLEAAMAASDISAQDPLEMAIFDAAKKRGIKPSEQDRRISLVPFDPATKRTEAVVESGQGARFRIVKGSPGIMAMAGVPEKDLEGLDLSGQRTIAVAKGDLFPEAPLKMLGLLSFSDPLRKESPGVVHRLRNLGIRVRLVTGDTPEAAAAVAKSLDLALPPCSKMASDESHLMDCEVFAGVMPEDKFHLVEALQKKGRIVGMTGDGVNDAPALKQAEVGIAVAKSSDIARAAASMILVTPGLDGLAGAVEEGRKVYHRIQNYVLNKIVKTLEVALFLSGGLLLFQTYVVDSRMILLLIFTNDFVTMSLASDHVRFSVHPNRWNIGRLMAMAILIAFLWLTLTLSVFYAGRTWLNLSPGGCQTLGFLTLVLTGLGNVLVIRERGALWMTKPSRALFLAIVGDLVVVAVLAGTNLLLTPLPLSVVIGDILLVATTTLLVDQVKGVFLRP